MLKNYVVAIQKIDKPLIDKWVEDLVLYKSYTGIVIQGIALKMIAKQYNKSHRRAAPKEESNGIDGYIGDVPMQIKPRNGENYNVLRLISNEIFGIYVFSYTTQFHFKLFLWLLKGFLEVDINVFAKSLTCKCNSKEIFSWFGTSSEGSFLPSYLVIIEYFA